MDEKNIAAIRFSMMLYRDDQIALKDLYTVFDDWTSYYKQHFPEFDVSGTYTPGKWEMLNAVGIIHQHVFLSHPWYDCADITIGLSKLRPAKKLRIDWDRLAESFRFHVREDGMEHVDIYYQIASAARSFDEVLVVLEPGDEGHLLAFVMKDKITEAQSLARKIAIYDDGDDRFGDLIVAGVEL